jgi:hypothetical protein
MPHQVGQRQLGVLAQRVGQVPDDEIAQAQPLIQLSDQQQAASGSHPSALEVNPQPATERELKRPFLPLTHRRSVSRSPRSHPNPRPSGLFEHSIELLVHLENGNPG